MEPKVSVKKVKEIFEKLLSHKWLTWEEAVAVKCDAIFRVHKKLMLKKWKGETTK